MNEPSVRFPGTPAGQPVTPSPAPVLPAVSPTSDKPAEPSLGNTAPPAAAPAMTPEQYREIARKEAAAIYQAAQSARDKAETRVKTFVSDQIASLKSAGLTITAEQEQQLAANAATRFRQELEPSPVVTPAPSPSVPGTPVEQPAAPDPSISQVERIAFQMAQKAGYDIYPGEPELATIVTNGTELEYMQSYQRALEAKAQRMGIPAAKQTNPLGAVPLLNGASPSGNPIEKINDPQALWDLAQKKR
jgi:hypothetical protein